MLIIDLLRHRVPAHKECHIVRHSDNFRADYAIMTIINTKIRERTHGPVAYRQCYQGTKRQVPNPCWAEGVRVGW